MTFGLAIAAIIIILATTWFLGLWNNIITLVNTIFAAMFASNFFEPMADKIDGGESSYTYLLDFVSLWLLFFIAFVVLRTATDLLSRYQLKFNIWVDRIGTTICSCVTAWVFICFMMFTFHTAPFPPGEGNFQAKPSTSNFVGSPDRQWLGFLQNVSRGAMSSSIDAALMPAYDANLLHNDDKELNCRVFDSKGDFIFRYHHRRQVLSEQDALRVRR